MQFMASATISKAEKKPLHVRGKSQSELQDFLPPGPLAVNFAGVHEFAKLFWPFHTRYIHTSKAFLLHRYSPEVRYSPWNVYRIFSTISPLLEANIKVSQKAICDDLVKR